MPTLAASIQIQLEAAMPFTSPQDHPRPASRRVGYVVTIALNAALLIVLNAQPGWQGLSFLTSATPQVLGLVNASRAVSLAVNLVYLGYDPRWLKALGDLVTAGFILAVAIRLRQVFPFEFHGSAAWLATGMRVMLIIGICGASIAILVQVVTLTLLASHIPPQHRPRTGH
jgi:hypothetical protein